MKMFCGFCPDSHCGKLLYFLSHVNLEVECDNCGQKHAPSSLLDVKETTNSSVAVDNLLKSILLSNTAAKKGTELVKVRGLSNFHCKLISPLLTKYGMDKKSGKAKLLSELGQGEVFNCSVFGNRAFLIEQEHLDTAGYGKDKTGSVRYLKDTLKLIENESGNDCLIPLHSDGDGHCLVHAISRAVVGRELLWHSLRQNLKNHLEQENTKYQGLFRDFVDANEWHDIIEEADPNYHPGTNEPFGLRNIHVFGLANVLHRPVILLDSMEGMHSSGDYSGLFLPVLVPLEECKSQGVLNKPLAIAWSSSARNHYVPLVGIKGSPLPKIPRLLLPKAWGVPNELILTYIDFDENNCCEIGGSRSLPDSYVQRLVSAMDEIFFEQSGVSPELVADVNQFVFKPTNAVGYTLPEIIEVTRSAVESERLFRCLSCQALKEGEDVPPRSWREPGGKWYTRAQETPTGIVADAVYTFTEAEGVLFMYSARYDMLVPVMREEITCDLCKGVLREVAADGSVRYMNGDRTTTKSTTSNGCKCGFKHFWNNKEYENIPKSIDISLEWGGKRIEEQVFWFDLESDPSLNSNVYELATTLVQKHFPGEFGSETLVRKVVDKILRKTELKKSEEVSPTLLPMDAQPMDTNSTPVPTTPTKIILTGPKQMTLHKEELTMNEEERLTKARITHRVAYSQKRKGSKESPEKPSGNTKHGKQENQKTSKENKSHSSASLPKQSLTASLDTAQTKPRDLRIRLSTSNGRTATVTLKQASTYQDLQEVIEAELGIPKHRQKIRYGFPPRELKPPEGEHSALPLTHGDKVSVEELPEPQEEKLAEEAELMDVEAKRPSAIEGNTSSSNELEGIDQQKLASDLLSLLKGALNVDRWEMLQNQPEMFERGGMIYDQVVSDLGPLHDDMHFTITGLPGKTFAYNAKDDRMEICLGLKHISVQPLDVETLSRAHTRTGDKVSLVRPHDERESLGGFSGALRHRNASEGRAAFSGAGRTLGGSVKTNDVEEKEGLSAMNVDVQSTSRDPNFSGTNMGKAGTTVNIGSGKSGPVMNTGGGMDLKNKPVVADIAMPAIEKERTEVGENAHETGSTEHEVSSYEHDVSSVEHVRCNEDEMADSGHELINSEHVEGTVNVQLANETAKHETETNDNVKNSSEHATVGPVNEG